MTQVETELSAAQSKEKEDEIISKSASDEYDAVKQQYIREHPDKQ